MTSQNPAPPRPVDDETTQPAAPAAAPPGRVTGWWRVAVGVLTVAGIALSINQVFFLEFAGLTLLDNSYMYLMLGLFLPVVFIAVPARKGEGPKPIAWYDVAGMAASVAATAYFAWHGEDIELYGWEFMGPPVSAALGFVLWGLVLEVLRRTAGLIVAILAAVVSLYPLAAGVIPVPFLQGVSYDLVTLAKVHAMGGESILGLPMSTASTLLVGFLCFATILQFTGGAQFFHRLASALFGRFRGGTAKVPIASSATLGMMSGAPVTNVLTTGPMTIPAMVRSGFSPRMAAGVEATASSGGSITPPIMGTAAFLMVSFAGVPYTEVLIAATIPAIFYFLGIFVQVDGYAARRGLAGEDPATLPKVLPSLLRGWPYLISLGLLTVLLLTTGSEAQGPYWVVLLLIVIAILNPNIRFGPRQWGEAIVSVGTTIATLFGIIAGVGLILGGLSATGVALSISRDLIALVGDHAILILITGAAACFVLGMGLTISAAYVFLAIVMVPALTALGIDTIAAHLFVIYWAGVSYITPPVGLAAIAAASIAKTNPMATSVEAMKLGAVKYLIPFGFSLNPALIAQGSPGEVALAAALGLVAVVVIGGAISGWLPIVDRPLGPALRAALAASGFALFLPNPAVWAGGLAVTAALVVVAVLRAPRGGAAGPEPEGKPAPAEEPEPGSAKEPSPAGEGDAAPAAG